MRRTAYQYLGTNYRIGSDCTRHVGLCRGTPPGLGQRGSQYCRTLSSGSESGHGPLEIGVHGITCTKPLKASRHSLTEGKEEVHQTPN